MSSTTRTLLVTLAAQAMSSVGLSVSIIAWVWFALYPPPKAELVDVILEKKLRRRSAPAALQTRKRQSLSPSVPESPSSPTATSPPRTRRVYFVDSPIIQSRPPERQPNDSLEILEKPLHASPTDTSPSSSSSTLVHSYPTISLPTLETCRESAVESDSSGNASPRRSLSLTRPFQKAAQRTRRSSNNSSVDMTIAPPVLDTKQQRRSSGGGLVPPWARRSSGPKSAVTVASPASSSSTSSSNGYFNRKAVRRTSTPVPRTQPYAYPYFAQPPVEDEAYVAYLRNLPQFTGGPVEMPLGSPNWSDSEEKANEPPFKGEARKAKNAKAQAGLGHGRPSSLRAPQRSASEGWVET